MSLAAGTHHTPLRREWYCSTIPAWIDCGGAAHPRRSIGPRHGILVRAPACGAWIVCGQRAIARRYGAVCIRAKVTLCRRGRCHRRAGTYREGRQPSPASLSARTAAGRLMLSTAAFHRDFVGKCAAEPPSAAAVVHLEGCSSSSGDSSGPRFRQSRSRMITVHSPAPAAVATALTLLRSLRISWRNRQLGDRSIESCAKQPAWHRTCRHYETRHAGACRLRRCVPPKVICGYFPSTARRAADVSGTRSTSRRLRPDNTRSARYGRGFWQPIWTPQLI